MARCNHITLLIVVVYSLVQISPLSGLDFAVDPFLFSDTRYLSNNQYGGQYGAQSHQTRAQSYQTRRPRSSSRTRETCRQVTEIVCRVVSVGAGAGAGAALGGPGGAALGAAGGQLVSEVCEPVSRMVCGRRRRSTRLVSDIQFSVSFFNA